MSVIMPVVLWKGIMHCPLSMGVDENKIDDVSELEPDIIIADARYQKIHQILPACSKSAVMPASILRQNWIELFYIAIWPCQYFLP